MTKIITIWSESGGVGKTTTALNLAAALGRAGYRTLIQDMDAQPASVTDYAGHTDHKSTPDDEDNPAPTINDILLNDDRNLEEIIIHGEHYDLVPAHEDLANLEGKVRSDGIRGGEFLLRHNLDTVADDYDFVLVDAPATLSLLVDNALIASDQVLIPMEMNRKGKRSVDGVLETVEGLKDQLRRSDPNFSLETLGVLPNRVSGSKLNQETLNDLREDDDANLLPVSIPDYNVMEDTWKAQMDLFAYAEHPDHHLRVYQESLVEAYEALAEYIVEQSDQTPDATERVETVEVQH